MATFRSRYGYTLCPAPRADKRGFGYTASRPIKRIRRWTRLRLTAWPSPRSHGEDFQTDLSARLAELQRRADERKNSLPGIASRSLQRHRRTAARQGASPLASWRFGVRCRIQDLFDRLLPPFHLRLDRCEGKGFRQGSAPLQFDLPLPGKRRVDADP